MILKWLLNTRQGINRIYLYIFSLVANESFEVPVASYDYTSILMIIFIDPEIYKNKTIKYILPAWCHPVDYHSTLTCLITMAIYISWTWFECISENAKYTFPYKINGTWEGLT